MASILSDFHSLSQHLISLHRCVIYPRFLVSFNLPVYPNSHPPIMASNSSPAAQTLLRRHPLQRFESPSRGPSALLHLTGLISFASSFKYLADHPNTITASYGWHFQYLTIVGLSLASTTFLLGLLADLTLSHRVFLLKNALSVTSAPLETLISLLYWGLRSIDTKLVLPDW
ncbi:hypothetical protein M501DRAFT_945523, partial [Patellaria atrata CBS 101060]